VSQVNNIDDKVDLDVVVAGQDLDDDVFEPEPKSEEGTSQDPATKRRSQSLSALPKEPQSPQKVS
jgi:hypothetical protein